MLGGNEENFIRITNSDHDHTVSNLDNAELDPRESHKEYSLSLSQG